MTGPMPLFQSQQLDTLFPKDFDVERLADMYRRGVLRSNPQAEAAARNLIVTRLGAEALGESSGAFGRGIKLLTQGIVGLMARAHPAGPVTAQVAQQLGNEQAAQQVKQVWSASQQLGQQFGHEVSVGLIPAPSVEDQEAWNAVVKPVASLGAMAAQGAGVVRALGYISKLPKATTALEAISPRLRDIGVGVIAGAAIDAARPEGVPDDPAKIDLSGRIAASLTEQGMNERLALGIGGAVLGGVFGATTLGIARGIRQMRARAIATDMTPEMEETIRSSLKAIGIEPETTADRIRLADTFLKNLNRLSLDEGTAGLMAERLSREEYVVNELLGLNELTPGSEDARLIAGIFRANSQGTSVISGITDLTALREFQQRSGIKLVTASIKRGQKYDVIIARPAYEYASFDQSASALGKRITSRLKGKSRRAGTRIPEDPTTESLLLADGTILRGTDAFDRLGKIKVPEPIIEGVPRRDIGAQQAAQIIRMNMGENRTLTISLPSRITSEQFNAIERAVNSVKLGAVEIVPFSGKAVRLENPLGARVQDAIADLVKPKSVRNTLTADIVKQVKNDGVFAGQAGVLDDGTPVEIMGVKYGKKGKDYLIRDPFLGETVRLSSDKVTVLPTSLQGELRPSNFFLNALGPEERTAFANLRRGTLSQLGKPLTKFRDLEQFASSRGFLATSLRGGKVELTHSLSGEAQKFENLEAAARFVRKSTGPMPELTPTEIGELLGGDVNLGWLNGGGTPSRFNEPTPIPFRTMDEQMQRLSTEGPTAVQKIGQPTMRFITELDRRFGTNFWPIYNKLQTQQVHKQNYITTWYYGKLPGLPKDIKPLRDIMRMAGPDSRAEKITAWLEVPKGGPEEAALVRTMLPSEVAAAKELRKWYNNLFTEFGIEADFVENYAPRWREFAHRAGATDPREVAKHFREFDPLNPPKGPEFWADNVREGLLDVYELDAWQVALKYLHQGAANRFMKEPMNAAKGIVQQVAAVNPRLAEPLGHYLEALRGTEFQEQRKLIGQTIKAFIRKLPGQADRLQEEKVADALTAVVLGTSYASAMGFRAGLAMRNLATVMLMNWPLYGGSKAEFVESIGKALTKAGRDEAAIAGAISVKQGSTFLREDLSAASGSGPEWLLNTFDNSMALYDLADELSRAVAYHAGKSKALSALRTFSEGASRGKTPEALRRALIKDSGMFAFDRQIGDEFLRRAATSPEAAAKFAGKTAADVTNFLYGRGMQPRWMRSVPGRLFGQFGTWSMWYLDYIKRMPQTMIRNGYRAEAAGFLARHALMNAAFLAAGHEVFEVDLGRWLTYPALFYSGGPVTAITIGASTLARGLGSAVASDEDPFAQSRVTQGSQVIWNTLPVFVPFFYAGRDVGTLIQGTAGELNGNELLAAVLSTRPTRERTWRDKMDIMIGTKPRPSFSSDAWALEDMLNGLERGDPSAVVDTRALSAGAPIQQIPGIQNPTQLPGQTGTRTTVQGPLGLGRPLPQAVPPASAASDVLPDEGGTETRPIREF